MTTTILIISLFYLLSVTCISWQVMRVAQTAYFVTLADGRRQERSVPLLIRLVLPFVSTIPKYILKHHKFEEDRRRIDKKLVAAGFEGLIRPEEIIGLRMIVPVFYSLLLGALLYFSLIHSSNKLSVYLFEIKDFFIALIFLVFSVYTDLWLKGAVKLRHRSIERALPFVLDLLTLSVEAGLDFMTGIQRIIQYRKIDPLNEELIRMFREIQVGRTRRQALQNMSARIDHSDLRSVTNALVQADSLGTSIGEALRIQSEQIRMKRFQRAEKLGNEAPIKMLFPLIAFIFPSVFLILLGPVLVQMFARGGF